MADEKMKETEARANREAKDSVFCDLFSQKKHLLRLYRDLHPEDEGAGEGDLDLVTLDRVLTRGQYNDLGFTARNRFVVLVEAQSTWSPNVCVRMLLYLADTYRRRIAESGANVYGSAPLGLPAPELYIVYTGAGEEIPEVLSFADDIVGDPASSVEVRVRVLRGARGALPEEPGIIDEYVAFARAFDEARAEMGPTLAAVEATIDACVERGVLREYLQGRRKEVVGMMMKLLDREEAMAAYLAEVEQEATRAGMEKGMQQGLQQGIEQGIEQGLQQVAERLRAAGFDEEAVRIALGDEPVPPR